MRRAVHRLEGKLFSFNLKGEQIELIGFNRPDPNALWVIFRDETSGKTSYGTGRSVTATKLDNGKWAMDFNKSANFPCSYTDFATCPLAPRENYLTVEIAGGEKTPPFQTLPVAAPRALAAAESSSESAA